MQGHGGDFPLAERPDNERSQHFNPLSKESNPSSNRNQDEKPLKESSEQY